MDTTSRTNRLQFSAVAGLLMLGSIVPVPAVAEASTTTPTVTVFADQYVVGRNSFQNLSTLEAHLTAMRAQAVRVQACGSAAARPWMAVVHRLRHLPIEPRMLGSDERECTSVRPLAMRVKQHVGLHAAEAADSAVDRYWQELMP